MPRRSSEKGRGAAVEVNLFRGKLVKKRGSISKEACSLKGKEGKRIMSNLHYLMQSRKKEKGGSQRSKKESEGET